MASKRKNWIKNPTSTVVDFDGAERSRARQLKQSAGGKSNAADLKRWLKTAKGRDRFFKSSEWRQIRYSVLKKYSARCQCCGATADDGVRIHVDHIKPISVFPELAIDLDNLQVLCEDCNIGKWAADATDWRPKK